jgi:hypothetical protein
MPTVRKGKSFITIILINATIAKHISAHPTDRQNFYAGLLKSLLG